MTRPEGQEVRELLGVAQERVRSMGLPRPGLAGGLLRPAVASMVRPAGGDDEAFWLGALAIQMVHEASVLHDDIIDGADIRRGAPTAVAVQGVGPALVQGDHLLTAAYSVAAKVGSASFLNDFIGAVERTVAGEIAQGRSVGRLVSRGDYRRMVADKSGELFGVSAALGFHVAGLDAERARAFGIRLGSLYQMVDDYLDNCPGALSGKAAYQDYRQRKWTWIMDLTSIPGFGLGIEELHRHLFDIGVDGRSPMLRAVEELEREVARLASEAESLFARPASVVRLMDSWVEKMRRAETASSTPTDLPRRPPRIRADKVQRPSSGVVTTRVLPVAVS